jgi:glutathione-regulated potassium-efflux system ancillary protein KefG
MEAKRTFSTLFVIAHPFLERSRANRAVLEAVSGVAGVTTRNLYDLYPYFHIDVEEEQRQMMAHDLVVIQHPFFWFSMPALLKLWIDDVWLYGWAYGPDGDKLKGKKFWLSITAGGPQNGAFSNGGSRFPVETLLAPWNQTVHMCGMNWVEPHIMHDSIRTDEEELRRHAGEVSTALEKFARTGVLA